MIITDIVPPKLKIHCIPKGGNYHRSARKLRVVGQRSPMCYSSMLRLEDVGLSKNMNFAFDSAEACYAYIRQNPTSCKVARTRIVLVKTVYFDSMLFCREQCPYHDEYVEPWPPFVRRRVPLDFHRRPKVGALFVCNIRFLYKSIQQHDDRGFVGSISSLIEFN
jgi:hypothetical protein